MTDYRTPLAAIDARSARQPGTFPLAYMPGDPLTPRQRISTARHFERTEPQGLGYVADAIRRGDRDDHPRVRAFAGGSEGRVA